MIGPIPIDDFGGPDPFSVSDGTGGPTPNAILAWQERQRRQRSVRLLMMFLMMLLLMDGEEPNRRRRENSIHLRQRGKRRGKGGLDVKKERMEVALYDARRELDGRVKGATDHHRRRRDILKLNGEKDVERSVWEWATVQVEREEAAAAAAEAANDEVDSELSNTAKKKIAADKNEDDEAGAGKRKVYHYPRNATGYYRGDWKRIDGGGDHDDDKSEGGDNDDENEGGGGAENGAGDDFEPDVKLSERALNSDVDVAATGDLTLINEDEASTALKRRLAKRRDSVGVLLLPPGLAFEFEAGTNATTPFYAPGRQVETPGGSSSSSASSSGFSGFLKGSSSSAQTKEKKKTAKKDPPKLSLTRKSGRTAFQLYARPIPAMRELSVVEGYVKLYDGSSSAFVASTKRDVLLRVRGVVIHGSGRMSLVANARPGRSALIVGGEGGRAAGADLVSSEMTAKAAAKKQTKKKKKKKVAAVEEEERLLASEAGGEKDVSATSARSGGERTGGREAQQSREPEADTAEADDGDEQIRRRRLSAALSSYLEAEGGAAPSFGGDGVSGASSFNDDSVLNEGDDTRSDGHDDERGVSGDSTSAAGLLEQIRDDALSLFRSTESLGEMKSLWHERSNTDGAPAGWAVLSSPEFEDDHLDEEYFDQLFYGEPSRQMAELVGSHLGYAGSDSGQAEAEAGGDESWWPAMFGRRSLRVAEEEAAKPEPITTVLSNKATGEKYVLEHPDPNAAPADGATRAKELMQRPAGTEALRPESEVEEAAEGTAKPVPTRRRSKNDEDGDESASSDKGGRDRDEDESAGVVKGAARGDHIAPSDAEIAQRRTRGADKRAAAAGQPITSQPPRRSIARSDVQPYPYAPDDLTKTLSKAPAQLARRIPHRELALENNGLECEFELSLDVKEIQWTVGGWRAMAGRHARDDRDLDPHVEEDGEGEDSDSEEAAKGKGTKKKERTHSSFSYTDASTSSNSHYRGKKSGRFGDDSLAMQLNGTIISPNCAFRSTVNVTAVRTDWEHTTGKAINYSFYMMLTCLTQIVVLLRQLLHTQSQSSATRVSLLCVGWQTVLDAVLCVGHIFLCLVMQPLFTAFASVAFFKLLIFCVIEMKYMAIILQARHNASTNPDNSAEELRRRVALLHLRFYGALMFATAGFWIFGQRHRTPYVLFLYSFWVPQIVRNVVTEAKKPLHPYFIYGMSVTRLVAPMYMFAVPNNFMKEVNPDFPTDLVMCECLVVWVGVQAAVLVAQGKYGARFMIPSIFLPPKFDYQRPIPASMMPPTPPPPSDTARPALNGADDAAASDASADAGAVKQRRGKSSRRGGCDKERGSKSTTMTVSEGTRPPEGSPTLDCVICYNDIDVSDRMGYMLAPCDHIFHRTCLEQWMDVKMECPICRMELPAL